MKKICNLILGLLLIAVDVSYAQGIKVKALDLYTNIIYFRNDTLVNKSGYFSFSPDSQTCVLLNDEFNKFKIYDYDMKSIHEISTFIGEHKKIFVSNDRRYISVFPQSSENLSIHSKVEFYSQTGKLLKNTLLHHQMDASFISNNFLALIYSKEILSIRGSMDRADTKLLILDQDFNVKYQKDIIYPSIKLLRPIYDSVENKYCFPYIANDGLIIKKLEFKLDN